MQNPPQTRQIVRHERAPLCSITSGHAVSGAAGQFEALLQAAVDAADVPFAVAMWGDSKQVRWTGSAGECAAGRAADLDTVMRIFSMTKAVGSTAAMLLVDRGKLDIETPVEAIVPGFADLQVLDGFDGDTPRLRAPAVKASVRHLATHTSGLVYEFWNLQLAKYLEVTGNAPILSGLRSGLDYPLAFDPGTRWDYGPGIDWLGLVVEAIDGRRIDQFCREELFEPLGMQDTDFEVSASMAERLATVSIRGEDGQFSPFDLAPPPHPEVYGMGHALYSTAPDYMRFLRMFLNGGELDGQRVLSAASVERMFANHIGEVRMEKMHTAAPPITADVDLFPSTPKTHSFGFMRVEDDVPGMRSAGSQGWAGVCNTHFWLDPSRDLAGLIMTQSLPFVEPRFMRLYANYERAVYAA